MIARSLLYNIYVHTSSIVDIFVYHELTKMWFKVYFIEKAKIMLFLEEKLYFYVT